MKRKKDLIYCVEVEALYDDEVFVYESAVISSCLDTFVRLHLDAGHQLTFKSILDYGFTQEFGSDSK